jgi:bacillithiol biosynthesis cysteine-adding enzyme BshC
VVKSERLPWKALGGHFRAQTLAYLEAADRVSRHFATDWRSEKALLAKARAARPVERETADAIESHLKSLGAPAESLAALAKLRGGAACVVTGQQPGVAGGPMYNLLKAATAVRLAQRLDHGGVPTVALFWIHSDDHNPAEVGRVTLPDGENRPQTLELPLEDDGEPLGGRGRGLAEFTEQLIGRLPSTPHQAAAAASLRAATRGTLAESFARILLRWFGARGLVVLEPHHVRGGRAQAVLDRAMREPQLVEHEVGTATQQLRSEGYEPSLSGGLGTNLFVIRDGRRRRLERSGGQLHVDGAPYDGGGRLSAGVALRPVVQDAALPTAAYVAGPNEISYFAQLGGLYRAFETPMPAIFPRASATIVESRVDRVAEKFALKSEELFLGRERLIELVSARAQRGLLEEVSRIDLDARSRLRAVEEKADPAVVDAARKTSEKIQRLLAAFRDRIVEAQRRSDEVSAAQLEKVANHLTPGGALQERRFTPWYYAAMFGEGVIDEITEAVDPFAGGHLLLRP